MFDTVLFEKVNIFGSIIHIYVRSSHCSHLIRGSVGKYGNLEVETSFEYDLNCPQICGQSQADAPKVVYLVRSRSRGWRQVIRQVWSLTHFYSVDFSKSRIGVKKCVFYKRKTKVCVSCC